MACFFVLRYWVISTYIGSVYPFVLWGSCFGVCVCVCVCVQSSFYCVRFIIHLVSYCRVYCVWARCIPCGRSVYFVPSRYSLLPKVTICNGFPL